MAKDNTEFSNLFDSKSSQETFFNSLKDMLNKKLVNIIDENKSSRDEIARILGITPDSVTNLTSARTMLSIDKIVFLCIAFDLRIEQFIDIEQLSHFTNHTYTNITHSISKEQAELLHNLINQLTRN